MGVFLVYVGSSGSGEERAPHLEVPLRMYSISGREEYVTIYLFQL